MKFVGIFFAACSALLYGGERIPVVDMNDFYSAEKREVFLDTVREALHEVGFFSVVNTGIDQEVIRETFGAARDFFNLSMEEKQKMERPELNYQRGYSPFGKEAAKGAEVGDFKEFYHIGQDFSEEVRERYSHMTNVWPESGEFEEKMMNYLHHLQIYMREMHKVLALALFEKEDFFCDMCEDADNLLRVIHYPANDSNPDKRAVWATEHTDIDLFTILPEATAEGLELQLADGTWVGVQAEPGSFIINAGDFLEIYSNGYFRSSRHRVMAPIGKENQERMSMVFFVHLRSEDLMFPLPRWIEKTGGEGKYAPATRFEMLMERLADLGSASDAMIQRLGKSGVLDRLIDVDRASVQAMCKVRELGFASDKVLLKLEELGL